MKMNLRKIVTDDARPIRELVLESIREAIFEGRLSGGEKLIENNIAESLGVSRTPVREALRQLELEGLVENTPNKGTVVVPMTVELAMQSYDVREVLEALAARIACGNLPRRETIELSRLLEQMEHNMLGGNIDLVVSGYVRWYDILLSNCQNVFLTRNLGEAFRCIGRFRGFLRHDCSQKYLMLELGDILACITAGDPSASEQAAKTHVKMEKQRFLEYARQHSL